MQPSIQITPQPPQNHPIPHQSLPTAFPPPVKRYLGNTANTRKKKMKIPTKIRHIARICAARRSFAAQFGICTFQLFRGWPANLASLT
jgi:hypothetical protein